ncbi:hypothetical protein EDD21DRAFT_364692 [Dissophora ornata]|nr:hypothetical protein EDD21DRAFT_364692 [Dissophora ornata]
MAFSTKFWDVASACMALESLALYNVSLQHYDIVSLWQVCLNLKKLVLADVILPFAPFPESLRHKPLRRMRSLVMDVVLLPTDYETEWFKLFPNLRTIGWREREEQPLSIEKLLPAIATATRTATVTTTAVIDAGFVGGSGGGLWRNLKSLNIDIRSDDHLAAVLDSIDSLNKLEIAASYCSLKTLDSLIRRHQFTITSLKFDRCQHVTSAMTQTILSKFPALEELVVPVLVAHDVSVGDPWICTQLKTLSTRIILTEFQDPTKGLSDDEYLLLPKDQEDLYARLSTLKRLVYLDIALSYALPGTSNARFLLLDLNHPGFLKMVASLRNLQTLLLYMSQRLSLEVAKQLVKCASLSLTRVDGQFHTSDGIWISVDDLLCKRDRSSLIISQVLP